MVSEPRDLVPVDSDAEADDADLTELLNTLPERDGLHLHIGLLPVHVPGETLMRGMEWLWQSYEQKPRDGHDLLLQLAAKGFAKALGMYVNYHIDAGHVDWPRLEIPAGENAMSYTMRYLTARIIGHVSKIDLHIAYQEEPGADGSLELAGVVPTAPGMAPRRVTRSAALTAAEGTGTGGGGAAAASDHAGGPRGGTGPTASGAPRK